ncbi:MAG: EAL domain-containing protein, partial [Anaerolineales bacterium]
FGYALVADAARSTQGFYNLTAEVSDPAGWKRTLELQPETSFRGDHFTSANELNLCKIERLVGAKELITGAKQAVYTVTVTPQVEVQGTVGGRPLSDSFAPSLTFQLDPQELHLVQPDPQQDPLAPTKEGVLPGSLTATNSLSILGAKIEVPTARRVSLGGLGLSLLGVLLFSVALIYAIGRDRAALVDFKYGPMLVGVSQGYLPAPGQRVVDVASIDDLAKLADREGYMILHERGAGYNRYVVQDGRDTYRFTLAQPSQALGATDLMASEKELQAALTAGQFQVYYQPILSLSSGKVQAVEALLRWNHPERGMIPAAEFIPAAEQTGLIVPIGRWALETACSQLKSWKTEGLPALSLLVNVSARQLKEGMSDAIAEVLKQANLNPGHLHLEIREASLLEDPETLQPRLEELKDLGVHLTLDNFSGKSPLEILKRMPISGLKIDRGSVEKMAVDSAEAAVTRAAVSAAHSMKLEVGAEGVETEEQLGMLRSQKVDTAQGYFLGRPVPANEVADLIRGMSGKPLRSKQA